MRKQDKIIVWPAYFDSNKTRKEGRKLPKNLTVPTPKLEEIHEASRRLQLQSEIIADTAYPKTPWQKVGQIKVSKKGSKLQTLRLIAKQLQTLRSQPTKK
ncbi:MAG: signal recognition particle subunit SRP19/SEC65 family protein [Candidatus Bathyarchaeia archaeon]